MQVDINQVSSMMRHYLEVKANYPDAILMYRLGDFYEMFFDDAITVSRELELTLTGRDCGLDERAPMCGVPYHAVDTYVSRLIHKGYKVAICEQLSQPEKGKKLVDRDVVRVITAGTVFEDAILDEKSNNFIASVYTAQGGIGIAYADISTGEFNLCQTTGADALAKAEDILNGIHASEIIANAATKDTINPEAIYRVPIYVYYDYAYRYQEAYRVLCDQFGVTTLQAFECEDCPMGISAAGALMAYFAETQKRALVHIASIKQVNQAGYMFFDTATRRNLELTETIRDRRKEGTLLWLLDQTQTSMGARTLRRWVDAPLRDESAINARLAAVDEYIKNNRVRTDLTRILATVRDLERLAGKISVGSVNPRDMLAIANTLVVLPVLKQCVARCKAPLLVDLGNKINLFEHETDILSRAICDNPPQTIGDGGFIANGFNADLDELTSAVKNGVQWIRELEERERQSTGIKNLKVRSNQVFGYYIEVTNLNKDLVPAHYMRKQTLAGAERFKTDELIELENKIFGAHDKAVALELAIFDQLRKMLLAVVPQLIATAQAIGQLDTLLSFAIVSMKNHYVRPVVSAKYQGIAIEGGRHPVVERLLGSGKFTPNDTNLDADCKTMVITGPNMAGKSTYMRQVALIVLMAHIGCFVSATKAKIALTDRIFTRVGASDDLTSAQSTFMVEMLEVANILRNATDKSLLIMDEIGRGTSTCDGLAIAWSVMEYVNNVIKAKTLFATHYHELTDLEGKLAGVKNFRIMVNEVGDKVVFLHSIARGGTNKSFGIEVAGLAGVPAEVCARAKEISRRLEARDKGDTNAIMIDAMGGAQQEQISMFGAAPDEGTQQILQILKETNIERMTPMQAMLVLADLIERANNG